MGLSTRNTKSEQALATLNNLIVTPSLSNFEHGLFIVYQVPGFGAAVAAEHDFLIILLRVPPKSGHDVLIKLFLIRRHSLLYPHMPVHICDST